MRAILLAVFALGLFAQDADELTKALTASRQRIDAIDDQIVRLLNERAMVVREVGVVKLRFHAPASAPRRAEQLFGHTIHHSSAEKLQGDSCDDFGLRQD